MTCYESLFRCFLGITAVTHNNTIIFGPKFSQAHRFALLMEAESKPIHDVDILAGMLVLNPWGGTAGN